MAGVGSSLLAILVDPFSKSTLIFLFIGNLVESMDGHEAVSSDV
jgi:hypothetical protein